MGYLVQGTGKEILPVVQLVGTARPGCWLIQRLLYTADQSRVLSAQKAVFKYLFEPP
jgi:hypothetical protein